LIQRTLNMVLESVTSTGEKDLYRTRIERTPTDTAEIFITHRGLEEVYSSNDKVSTVWQPRPRDPELEAEMLQRLLLRFEAGDAGNVAQTSPDKPAAGKGAGTTLPTISHVVKDGAESRLEVDEPFDRAWRRVGLALDRGGFTVEDRDRTKGLYFVRYLDPDYQSKQRESRGVISRIFGSDAKIEAQQFRVALLTEGDRTSVRVQDKDGHPEAGSAGDRILKQLDEQMR
jgi:outer membrane protein assembly factor BamC